MKPSSLIIPLRGMVVYPGMILTIPVARPATVAAVDQATASQEPVLLVPQLDPEETDVAKVRLAKVGTLVDLLRVSRLPDGSVRLLVQGTQRLRVTGPIVLDNGVPRCPTAPMPPPDDDPIQVGALARQAAELYAEFHSANGLSSQDHMLLTAGPEAPERLADQIAAHVPAAPDDQFALLEDPSVANRLDLLIRNLVVAVAALQMNADVNARVQAAMDKSQREYHLREQLKIIQTELGEAAGGHVFSGAGRWAIRSAEAARGAREARGVL